MGSREDVFMTEDNKNSSILIVDDTPENLRLLAIILSGRGYRVRPVSNGEHAMVSIRKEQPDLILLDIMMPDMDGYEVCRQLKSDKETASIPVIFISALYETIDKVKAFDQGGVDYITKPFKTEEVMARVKTHLTLRNLQLQMEKKNAELRKALDEIKVLRGFLPICASCKRIRNDKGYWEQLESYISNHSEATFSHGCCEKCAKKLYPELLDENKDFMGDH